MALKPETARHANWLELFFDLIFVFAIAKTTHILTHLHNGHLSWPQIGVFFLTMIPVWWAWTGHTMFTTRFDSKDTIQRFLTLMQMLAVVFFASFIGPEYERNYQGLVYSYLAIRIILICMYIRASTLIPEARAISKYLGFGFSIGLIISFSSLLVESPFRYLLLYAGILVEILTPMACKKILKLIPVHSYHMPERFGLFTIILLGETIIAIAAKLNALTWKVDTLFMAINGFTAVCAIWWLYFEIHEEKAVGQELGTGQRIVYGHLGVYCALSIISAAIYFSMDNILNSLEQITLTTSGTIIFIISLYVCYGKNILSSNVKKVAMTFFSLSVLMIYFRALT